MTDDDEFAARFAAEQAELEAEFTARFAGEQDDEFKDRLLTEKRTITAKAEKFLSDIRKWQTDITSRLAGIEDKPAKIVHVHEAPGVRQAPQTKPKRGPWRLDVTSRENGLMRTVTGRSDDRAIQFTISRTPDGFPKAIEAVALE